MRKRLTIRTAYLYLFSLVGLVLIIVGMVRLVNLGLKVYIFTDADISYRYPGPAPKLIPGESDAVREEPTKEELDAYYEKERRSRRQRDAAGAFASLIIGVPLYVYHWTLIRRERD
ncbi:MAG TPA: hypothetical protein ENH86_01370 [Candidatus Jorgensenbacteria bacterium]|uniref:DUF5671 domain-containing protein n=1 Tax=marine sediment metagenome TaxID=412755 RepID=A0A0F9DI55_9ZZZZ|nr:hypothetical protein [Candidatus Jorgensenbacteria bacterium]